MWHEQRKEEKRIKGLLVDKRKRAERRRDYYEKIKTDPNQFLQVHGRPLKIHLDVNMALAADSPTNMMPWNGDKTILIDRFDVRANLDFIPEYKPVQAPPSPDYKEAKELRQTNYERYRILIQNDFLGVQEEKFLKMIDLEEKYGGTTYQNQKAKEDKKKAGSKAAIGFVYADSTGAEPESEPEPSDSDSDSEIDFDLNVDVMALGTEEQNQLNMIGLCFELGKKDFVRMLAKDVEETEELKMQREKEAEKSTLSGKKSRRERKLLKEKRLEGRAISPPSFAARTEKSKSRSYSRSDSESSEEDGEEEKVEFITSFGGGESDQEGKHGITFRKRKKEYKDPIGPDLPSSDRKKRRRRERSSHRSRRKSRSRSKSRSRRTGSRRSRNDRNGHKSSKKRSRTKSGSRSKQKTRTRTRTRSRSRSKSKSRSGSKSSSRCSLRRGSQSPADEGRITFKNEGDEPVFKSAAPHLSSHQSQYKPPTNHHPSMLAYPPPPKPDTLGALDFLEREATPPPQTAQEGIPPGFVPPLPKIPHPDELTKDSSDSSDDEENKNGYRSKYRNKHASSDEETKPRIPKVHSAALVNPSENLGVLSVLGAVPCIEPPPVKRYYGRRKENESDSELSLDSDNESKKISHKIKQRVEKKIKESSSAKEETLVLKEKIRKKMQQQIKRTYKEDKKAEQERLRKLEEEQFFREEELREISEKMKAKEREKRRLERSSSRSRSRERRRSRSRNRRSRSKDRRRSRSRDKGSRSRRRSRSRDGGIKSRSRSSSRRGSRNKTEGRLVDY